MTTIKEYLVESLGDLRHDPYGSRLFLLSLSGIEKSTVFTAFFSDPDAAPLVANAPVSDMIITSEELKKVIDTLL